MSLHFYTLPHLKTNQDEPVFAITPLCLVLSGEAEKYQILVWFNPK